MLLLTVFCFMAPLVVFGASIDSKKEIVENGDVDGFDLSSPWAVAVDEDGDVLFSNFGAPGGSVDWVGKKAGSASKLYDIGDVDGDDVKIMHIKDIAVNGNDVYLASYGGPTDSYILQCSSSTCKTLRTISGENLQPTAVAYSTKLDRLFYAVADGDLNESKIWSVKPDGNDRKLYVEQSSKTGVAFPVGLAIDDVNMHVYWSNDVGPDQIQRGPLAVEPDQSKIGTVFSGETDTARPYHIDVDPVGRHIYFTDQSSSDHKIARVNYSGEELDTLIELDDAIPHGLALDVEEKKIYWTQTGTASVWEGEVDDLNVKPAGTGSPASTLVVASATAVVGLVAALL